MAKRGAGIQLTDRNWDNEEETEQAGHFKVAGDDQLSKRIIKKAKRRVPGGGNSASTFKAFQGFGVPQLASTPMTNTTSALSGFKGFGNHTEKKETNAEKVITMTTSEKPSNSDSVYMNQLKRLNHEVCEWIKKHINENPHVDLTPVFKDYQKHMLNLEMKFPASNESGVKFGEVASSTKQTSPGFFGSAGNSMQTICGPSSSIGTPTFNGGTTLAKSSEDAKPGDETDDTPKTQSQVKSTPEEDSYYSTRCKLFFKRGDDWAELGVGMLSLKKIEEKIQVLIRNDTAMAKIILNVFASAHTPTSRSGKNNVLLMSVPNPPVFGKEGDNTKPVSYLIRVKTSMDADELHRQMQSDLS